MARNKGDRQPNVDVNDGKSRYIKLMHIKTGNIHTMKDEGCDKTGTPSQTRSHLMRMMRKTIGEKTLDGKNIVDEDGFPIEYPVFRLAEAPEPFPWNKHDPKERAIAKNDKFDRDFLRGQLPPTPDGKPGGFGFLLAERDPAWMAKHEQLKKQHGELTEEYLNKVKNAQSAPAEEIVRQVVAAAEALNKAAPKGGKRAPKQEDL